MAGTVVIDPGSSAIPGLVTPGTPAGALLASLVVPFSFSSTAGTTSGTLTSAVYREASGTLDFYYQVANSSSSATSLSRETDTSFSGFTTFAGYRTDAVGPFVAGLEAPVTADRNAAGALVGFNFAPPDTAKILPGTTSDILVISTNATAFAAGNAAVLDGGLQTVASFEPTGAPTPEPGTLLIGAGLLAVTLIRRKRSA